MTGDPRIRAFVRAAKRGDVRAQLHLAASFALGDGVRKSETEAARWYAAAAAQGSGDAAYNLATMYQRGEGVRKNLRKAITLYKRAEKLGSGDASVALGSQALAVDGAEGPDPVAALQHFARAALNRDIRGLYLIAQTLRDYPHVTAQELVPVLLRASASAGYKEAEKLLRSLTEKSRR